MRFLFKSRRGLGDLLFMMPACLHLSRQDHDAWIEAPERWWDMFQLVSYVRCWKPGAPRPHKTFDTNLLDFRFSRSKIRDYIIDAYPELADVPRGRTVLFDRLHQVQIPDYGLPQRYILISPFGYSQPSNPNPAWFIEEIRRRIGHTRNIFILTDKPREGLPVPTVIAKSVAHLPRLIADAEEFFTVNSAPSIIAGAVRSRPYFHVRDHGYRHGDVDDRCNYEAPNQIVIDEREPTSMRNPIFESWYAADGQGSGPGSGTSYTEGWRSFLEGLIRTQDIESIVDLGCGDWQFSRLIDWGDARYLGVDVVPSLVERLNADYGGPTREFRLDTGVDLRMPSDTDLVIVKDVLQHLPNAEILRLLAKLRRVQRCLFVNDISPDPSKNNKDIAVGGYRCLDLTRPPFSLRGHEVFRFPPQPHTPELPKICLEVMAY